MKKINLKIETFPLIHTDELLEEITEKRYYDCFTLSTFDHWLTDEEAKEGIVFYSKKMTKEQEKTYQQFESKYIKSFIELYNSYNIVAFYADYSKENPIISYFTFSNISEFENICINSLHEKELFKLCIPDIGIIIEGGYDLTNLVFYKKELEVVELNKIQTIFLKNGLFVLNT